MTDTKGYIYFAIKTENEKFGLAEFKSYLTIEPTNFKQKNQNGKVPKCTIWEYSSRKLKNPYYYEEIEKLVDKLENHKSEFIKLKNDNPELQIILQTVIFLGDESPGLSFSNRTIQFINELNGEIDCDIYNEK